ncbi:MAG: ABC transporter permease [Spirochaetaceae bacterium]|nr:MAG: ABC transporter permease [Spirochaetaceae bacterium]
MSRNSLGADASASALINWRPDSMQNVILRRVAGAVFTMWIILTILFFLFRLGLPDPTVALVSDGLSPDDRAIVMQRFGLDRPLHEQYFIYLRNAVTGELGRSFHYNAPVAGLIGERFLNTIVLMIPALILSYTIGPLLGVMLAWKRGSKLEVGGITTGLVLRSAPMFWTGMLAVMVFGIWFGWFPTSGMRTFPYTATGFLDKILTVDFLRHLIMPTIVITLYYTGLPMLIMRNTMLEVMGDDFIEFAHARGLGARRVMYRHAARNALLPVITQLAITVGLAAGGQVVVEVVFSWPGLGLEMFNAVRTSDYPLAQASFMLLAGLVLLMNLIVDMIYTWLDPRISFSSEGGR